MMKGHKRGCRCVGCSSETRRRGMAALGLVKRRRRALRRSGFSSVGAQLMERALNRRSKRRRSTTAKKGAARAMRRRVRQLARRAVRSYSRNPSSTQPRRVIGTSPTLHTSSGKRFHYPGGVLLCGDTPYAVKIFFPRGRGRFAPLLARISFITYTNAEKARRLEGEVRPWKHTFKSRPMVSGVEGGGAWQKIHLRGDSPLWRAS